MRQLGLVDAQSVKIARADGGLDVSVYRFDVLHLVRPSIDAPPLLLERGNVILPPSALTARTIDGLADRLTAHLLHRIRGDPDHPGEYSLTGGYLPSSDRYDPAVASPEDTALAAYALGQRVRYLGSRDHDNPRQMDADVGMRRLMKGILAGLRAHDQAQTPATLALTLLTLVANPDLPDSAQPRTQIADQLMALHDDSGHFRDSLSPDSRQLNEPTQALVVAALAASFELTHDANVGQTVRQWLDSWWDKPADIAQVPTLPWALIAETHYGQGQAGAGNAAATQPQPRLQRLSAWLKVLREHQVAGPPEVGPADVVGGFEMENHRHWLAPDPDWRSAFSVDALAIAIRLPGAVGDNDRSDWLLTCALGSRFLAQLMFDEPSCYYVRSPADADGGVRVALWDNRLGVTPTAMALLASIDLQETLAVIAETGGIKTIVQGSKFKVQGQDFSIFPPLVA